MSDSMTPRIIPVLLASFVWLAAIEPPDLSKGLAHNRTIEEKLIQQTIEPLVIALKQVYFDPEIASKTADFIQKNHVDGHYSNVRTIEEFAELLTHDLFAFTHDKHLMVKAVLDRPPIPNSSLRPTDSSRKEIGRRSNHCVQRVEILPGNVGYLNITAFYQPNEVRETLASAMAFLANADALIIDMRENAGGSPASVALLTSYFFNTQNLPLFEVIPRPGGEPTFFSTESSPLLNRNESRPVYVLISTHTISGGEAFAFALKERHRAEVIGETTAGAANRVGPPRIINSRFEAFIPNGHGRSSVTGKNWEGVGVVPDFPAKASTALQIAHSHALKALLKVTARGSWHDTLARCLADIDVQHPELK